MLGATKKRKLCDENSSYELMKMELPAFTFDERDVGALQVTLVRPRDVRDCIMLPLEAAVLSHVVRFVQSHGYTEAGRSYTRSPVDLPQHAHWTKRTKKRDGVTLSFVHPDTCKAKKKLFVNDDEDIAYTSKL